MGCGKSIHGMGICPIYNNDPNVFSKALCELLDINLNVRYFYGDDYKLLLPEDSLIDNKKDTTFELGVDLYANEGEYMISQIKKYYNLYFDIQTPFEDSLEIKFYPNGAFNMSFLTFNSLWSSFIGDLKGDDWGAYRNREHMREEFDKLRNAYKRVLKKLDITDMLIYTDNLYNFCNYILYEMTYQSPSDFEKIVKAAKEKDNLKVFDFDEILKTQDVYTTHRDFTNTKDRAIVLYEKII